MKEVLNLSGFILLIIGTLGLVIAEFISDWGRAATLTFAALNVVGLGIFAFTHWCIQKTYKT